MFEVLTLNKDFQELVYLNSCVGFVKELIEIGSFYVENDHGKLR